MPVTDAALVKRDYDTNDATVIQEIKGLSVLAVDDNEVNRTVVQALLEPLGIHVEQAESAEQALVMIDAAKSLYDLVFMDLRMPGISGIEATRMFREKYDKQQLPIIALTGDLLSSVIQECEAAGMNDFLGKPVIINDLVNSILRARHLSAELRKALIYLKNLGS